ncbi:MAG: BsuPI-related putative proteinase inhibitor [Bacillota bacterium]|nr:BsuPI-related putative proteinase inhibitor [Bacillota bacterium]
MRKKFLLAAVCILIVSMLGASISWASPNAKDFLPPGLAKKGKTLPPPFQNGNMINLSGSIEGNVVLVKEVDGKQWLVIEGLKELKALKSGEEQTLYVGDTVLVDYKGDEASSIKVLKTSTENQGKLRYVLTTSLTEATVGDNLVFNLFVQNPTSNRITHQLNSSQRYDFIVKKDGIKVWQWSDHQNFLTILQDVSINANETVAYSSSWKPERSGEYTVEAYFLGEGTSKPVAVKSITINREVLNPQLNYTLTVHPTTIVLGREINFNLNIKNNTKVDITKQFSSGQIYDYIIRKDGRKVWQWSEDYDYIGTEMQVIFKPGDNITLAASWKPEATGKYTVEAYFLGESNRPVGLGEFTGNSR